MGNNPILDFSATLRKPADMIRAQEALRAQFSGAIAAERSRLDAERVKPAPVPVPQTPTPPFPTDGLKTPAQAARRLGVSNRTLRGLVTSGEVRYVNVGRGKQRERVMFTDSDLDDFVANRTRQKAQQSCLSTSPRARRSTTSISSGEVLAFTARRNGRTGGKRKP
jgi:excisionase family DNA binding protein